jgi:hypothetical protein
VACAKPRPIPPPPRDGPEHGQAQGDAHLAAGRGHRGDARLRRGIPDTAVLAIGGLTSAKPKPNNISRKVGIYEQHLADGTAQDLWTVKA